MTKKPVPPRPVPRRRPSVEYSWSRGGPDPGVEATVLGNWVRTYQAETGDVPSRADLLKAATPVDDPKHAMFNWDNRTAGHSWRLQQASMFLCRLVVNMITPAGREHSVRAFVSVTPAGKHRGFMAFDQAMADPILRAQVVQDAWEDLQTYARKFAMLMEYPSVHNSYAMFAQSVRALAPDKPERDAA